MEAVMAPLNQERYPIYTERNPPPKSGRVTDLRIRDNDEGYGHGNGFGDGDDGDNESYYGDEHGHHQGGGGTYQMQDMDASNQEPSFSQTLVSPPAATTSTPATTPRASSTAVAQAASITSPTSTRSFQSAPFTSAIVSLASGSAIGSFPSYTTDMGRKGLDGDAFTSQTSSLSSATATAAPSFTAIPALQDDSGDTAIGGTGSGNGDGLGNGQGDGNGNGNGNGYDIGGDGGEHHNSSTNGLSSTAEHLLIAAGTIGAFILICATIYFLMRLFKKDPRASLNRYKQRISKMWRRSRPAEPLQTQAEDFSFYSEEKRVPTQRRLDAFFSPDPQPEIAVPASTATVERANSQRKALVHDALVKNPPPVELMRTSGVPLEYPPPPFYTPQAMPMTPAYTPTPANQDTYATYNTNQRMSELSSLSSGFGDAKIDVPESGPSNGNAQRKSAATRASRRSSGLGFISRFSWATSIQTPRTGKDGVNRDTVYTTESEESVPRFRSIYSWVNQQSSRVRRQGDSERELENMPQVPRQAKGKPSTHKRMSSGTTDPAFRYHPGDELQIKRGSRVPSEILDKALGR